MIYAEIKRRDPVGASRAIVEHFAIMEARARQAGLSMDARAPTSTKTEVTQEESDASRGVDPA